MCNSVNLEMKLDFCDMSCVMKAQQSAPAAAAHRRLNQNSRLLTFVSWFWFQFQKHHFLVFMCRCMFECTLTFETTRSQLKIYWVHRAKAKAVNKTALQ